MSACLMPAEVFCQSCQVVTTRSPLIGLIPLDARRCRVWRRRCTVYTFGPVAHPVDERRTGTVLISVDLERLARSARLGRPVRGLVPTSRYLPLREPCSPEVRVHTARGMVENARKKIGRYLDSLESPSWGFDRVPTT